MTLTGFVLAAAWWFFVVVLVLNALLAATILFVVGRALWEEIAEARSVLRVHRALARHRDKDIDPMCPPPVSPTSPTSPTSPALSPASIREPCHDGRS